METLQQKYDRLNEEFEKRQPMMKKYLEIPWFYYDKMMALQKELEEWAAELNTLKNQIEEDNK